MRLAKRSVLVFALLAVAPFASAESIAISHDGIGCIQAGKFPQFFARFDPRDAVSRARLHFRPPGFPHWYSVPMKQDGLNFVGILPKPEKSLSKFEYYISVTDANFNEARTQEYAPAVVSGPGACQQNKALATALPKVAHLLVNAPEGLANAPLVPAGFSSNGVIAGASGAGGAGTTVAAAGGAAAAGAGAAAASGGLSAVAITGIVVGGAGAVAGGVAVATHKGTSSGASTTSPVGNFAGTVSAVSFTATNATNPSCVYLFVGVPAALTMTLSDSGGSGAITYPTPAGTIQYSAGPASCCGPSYCGPPGVSPGASLQFTVSGANVTGTSNGAGGIGIWTLQGTRAGSTVSGTFSLAAESSADGTQGPASGTWTATKQ